MISHHAARFAASHLPTAVRLLTLAQIENVELALSGRGQYLGITAKDKLLGQLEVLQTKEAQLQKKELLIMGGGWGCRVCLPFLAVVAPGQSGVKQSDMCSSSGSRVWSQLTVSLRWMMC